MIYHLPVYFPKKQFNIIVLSMIACPICVLYCMKICLDSSVRNFGTVFFLVSCLFGFLNRLLFKKLPLIFVAFLHLECVLCVLFSLPQGAALMKFPVLRLATTYGLSCICQHLATLKMEVACLSENLLAIYEASFLRRLKS